MVKPLFLLGLASLLAGCDSLDQYQKPIALTPHGAAVRANMAAHIIDPRPPGQRPLRTDAQRPTLANERYRLDQTKEPKVVTTAPATASE